MKVLITGGAGYIGSHCNRYFSEQGAETVVVDDLSYGHAEAVIGGRFVKGDFGDSALIDGLMSAERFDAIVHFAASANVGDSVLNPGKYYRNNITNMQTLLDLSVNHGIKYFIFSSSASIFGEPRAIPIDENHVQEPINPYGFTKLAGEKMLMDYEIAYDIRFCAFRYFNAAGASPDGKIGESHEPEHHLIPNIFQAILRGKTLEVFGDKYPTKDGSCLRDYVHVNDLVEAHYLGLKHLMDGNGSQCFNLGSGDGFTVFEMLAAAQEIAGKKLSYKITNNRPGDPAKLVASNEKAKKLLGWELKRSDIRQILGDAYNWESNRRF